MFGRFNRVGMLAAVAALVMLSVGAALWEARADSEIKQVVNPSPLLEPAKQAYKASAAAYDVGTVGSAEMYYWSRRWMEAEVASANTVEQRQQAKKDHLQRMGLLHGKIKALHDQGVVGGEAEKFYAARYYYEEAKLLAAE